MLLLTSLSPFLPPSQMHDHEKSLADGEECIRIAPNWPKGYLRAARALMSLERGAEAASRLRKALEIAPRDETLLSAYQEAMVLAQCTERTERAIKASQLKTVRAATAAAPPPPHPPPSLSLTPMPLLPSPSLEYSSMVSVMPIYWTYTEAPAVSAIATPTYKSTAVLPSTCWDEAQCARTMTRRSSFARDAGTTACRTSI